MKIQKSKTTHTRVTAHIKQIQEKFTASHLQTKNKFYDEL
jgi:hypothetical protein